MLRSLTGQVSKVGSQRLALACGCSMSSQASTQLEEVVRRLDELEGKHNATAMNAQCAHTSHCALDVSMTTAVRIADITDPHDMSWVCVPLQHVSVRPCSKARLSQHQALSLPPLHQQTRGGASSLGSRWARMPALQSMQQTKLLM